MVIVIGNGRLIALFSELSDFGGGHAEDDGIVTSDSFKYLDVCTVKCTECYSTVYHEFHVACT